MDTQHKDIFNRLQQVIFRLFELKDAAYISRESLEKTYWEYFSQVIDIAYIINLSSQDIAILTQQLGEQPDKMRQAEFLCEHLETDTSYILLNYFLYQFLQAYISLLKDDCLPLVEHILQEEGVTEQNFRTILRHYHETTSAYASPNLS